MNEFLSIITAIENRWKKCHYDPLELPSICADELNPEELADLVNSSLKSFSFPLKPFEGHPSRGVITVAESSKLAMFVHTWYNDIGTPHHHAWSGFFMSLGGPVIHSVYDHEPKGFNGTSLKFGSLNLAKQEILNKGSLVPVYPGKDYIHGLWHINNPSLSISVRSINTNVDELTMDYDRYSGIAICYVIKNYIDEIVSWIELYRKLDASSYHVMFDRVIEELDACTVLEVLHNLISRRNYEIVDRLLNSEYNIEENLLEHYRDYAKGMLRNELFRDVRSSTKDFDIRALFGALYVAHSKEEFIQAFRLIYPDDKLVEKAPDLLMRAIETDTVKQSGSDAKLAMKNYFKHLLSGDSHQEALGKCTTAEGLSDREKDLLIDALEGTHNSSLFMGLY